MAGFEVVVCGGGVAGVEGLLRLHRLAGGGLSLTLVAPEEFIYRPLAVQEPFAGAGARSYPLQRIADDTGAQWVQDRLLEVDRDAQTVRTEGGGELRFDALLLALGGREETPFEHAEVFDGRNADETLHGLVQDIELGYVNSIAFILPDGRTWPLPLYELALLTADRAHSMDLNPQLMVITPEAHPLQAFGGGAGTAVEQLLDEAGIVLHRGVSARVLDRRTILLGEGTVQTERIVTLPRIVGPAVPGVPSADEGFVPIDELCVVRATHERVFAAGDASDFPIKHGGIGSQQADTAAAGIVYRAGLGDRPEPLRPVIRGKLLTGGRPLYLSAHVIGGHGWDTEVYRDNPPWPADEKIVAAELGPYLETLDREQAAGA